jgi:hypothetical protein
MNGPVSFVPTCRLWLTPPIGQRGKKISTTLAKMATKNQATKKQGKGKP